MPSPTGRSHARECLGSAAADRVTPDDRSNRCADARPADPLMSVDPRRVPVLRAAVAMGSSGLARASAQLFLLLAFVFVLFVSRSDLLRPGDIGTDASNYYAAALRLIEGGHLYAMAPGDRPVPVDSPPLWSVPLLSPPPIAVAWIPPALLLPGALVMYVWWLVGLVGAMGTAVLATRAWSARALLATVVLSMPIALTAISGNINAWLIPAYAVVFALTPRGSRRRTTTTVALIAGSAAAFKLSPVLLVWWLLIRGRRGGAIGAVVVIALWLGASVLAAGPGVFASYLEVARGTAGSGATPLSASDIALALGVPAGVVALAPFACLTAAALGAFALRRRPAAASVVIVLGTIYATPVVRFESFALLVAPLAVYAGPARLPSPGRLGRRSVVAPVGFAAAVAVTLWIGSAPESSLLIQNRSQTPIIVRAGVAGQEATFGYMVELGGSARGYGTVPGGLTGAVRAFRVDCTEIEEVMPPVGGGVMVVYEDGAIQFGADPGGGAPYAPYVPDCATR